MDVYIHQAALLCAPCALGCLAHFSRSEIEAGADDSDKIPQGPYSDGGGEADSPQHCDACQCFLENPLTGDGLDYARDKVRDFDETGAGAASVIEEWREFYGIAKPLSLADLKQEFRIDFPLDHWGHTMGALFDVAAELYHRCEGPPDAWEYQPGAMGGDPREPESAFFEPCRDATTAALKEFGDLLHRLSERLRREGKSY